MVFPHSMLIPASTQEILVPVTESKDYETIFNKQTRTDFGEKKRSRKSYRSTYGASAQEITWLQVAAIDSMVCELLRQRPISTHCFGKR